MKTSKQLKMVGNFHSKGDVDKLYLRRAQESLSFKIIAKMY